MNSLKGLYIALKECPILTEERFGKPVEVLFGGSNVVTTDAVLPRIVIVPLSGEFLPSTGYNNQMAAGTQQRAISGVKERVDIYLWAASDTSGALTEDHYDAVEDLRMRVLQAFGQIRWQTLYWIPKSETWNSPNNLLNYGAGLTITVQAEITIPDVEPITIKIKYLEQDIEIVT